MTCLGAIVVIGIGEVVAWLVFATVKHVLGPPPGSPADKGSTARGLLERLALVTGMLGGFPHIITAFAALKLGTRLSQEQGSKISNSYFLVGNLISLLLAMLYAIIIRRMWGS